MIHDEDESGDITSSSSSSIMNNGLFPVPKAFHGPKHDPRLEHPISESSIRHGEAVSIISNSSSIDNFRDVFRRPSDGTHHYDLSEESNMFRLNFDTASDLNTIQSEDKFSLDSSIINQMSSGINDFSTIPNADDDSRFKYLRLYEKLRRSKTKENHIKDVMTSMKNDNDIPLQVMNTSSSSIFGLSRLDDFNKYVKQTEINDQIFSKMSSKRPHDNLLNVVATKEFADRFDANDDNFQDESRATKPKPSWYNKDHWKLNLTKSDNPDSGFKGFWNPPKHQSKSDIEENFYVRNASPSSSNQEQQPTFLQRKLKVRHLQMISFGGTLGVGLFLNTGKALTIAGGFGTLLAFVICGIIVLATIISFCEMVTFISVVDGVSGLSSRFVDDAFGFAVGWLYFVSFAFGLAGEVVASVIMLSYYPELDIINNQSLAAGFVALFLFTIVIINLTDVRVFGEIEYISSFIKLLGALIMIVIMIVLNTGGFNGKNIGFKYWQHLKSDFEHNLIFGLFRPSFNLHDNGSNSSTAGIGGDKGNFMSLLVAILVVSYAYSGTEIVCIAACEAKNPRKALPSATKRVFWRIIIFYCLSAFMVSLNVYAGDPRLLRYLLGSTGISEEEFNQSFAIEYVGGVNCHNPSTIFGGYGSGAQSPWIIALQSSSMCKFSSVVNGFLVFFAVSCGNAQLYVSSRTIYSLALQRKAPKYLTYCNRYGTPYVAVLVSASFGLLAFICVSERATLVFQNLTSIIASSGVILWFAMCLSYIRFYFGLKRRPDIISRDDKSYPYKSPFQPYSAIVGLIGSSTIFLSMGFVVFLEGEWSVVFFFASYGTLIVFAILYLGYKIVKGTRIHSLDTLDFDSGRTEMDRYIWDGGREYNIRSFKDVMRKCLSFLA